MECVKYETQLLLCWSFQEAGQYLKTMKAFEGRAKTTLEGRSQAVTDFARAAEVLTSVRRINVKDSERLLAAYGSLSEVICCPDYNDFMNLENIGQAKIESLSACFKGPIQ